MDIVLRIITMDGELVKVIPFENEFRATEAMDEVTGYDLVAQVIIDGLIYAEEIH